MELLEALREEHRLIERVAGTLIAFAERRSRGDCAAADGEALLRFFRLYAGDRHHGREEEILFAALAERAELPRGKGPIAALVGQHNEMAAALDVVEARLREIPGAPLLEAARKYAHALWQHIDAEDSVLFPESEERLRRAGVHELPDRPASAHELSARAEGERLVVSYPPVDDGAVRGEGCVMCPSYGTTCEGIEREWWNEWEWETLAGHAE